MRKERQKTLLVIAAIENLHAFGIKPVVKFLTNLQNDRNGNKTILTC